MRPPPPPYRLRQALAALLVVLGLAGPASPAAAQPPPSQDDGRELHVVSIYEGFNRRGGVIHGDRAEIVVDRPGRTVSLFLAAFHPMTWLLTVAPGTKVDRVVLGGTKPGAVRGLPPGLPAIHAWGQGSPSASIRLPTDAGEPVNPLEMKIVAELLGRPVTAVHAAYDVARGAPMRIEGTAPTPRQKPAAGGLQIIYETAGRQVRLRPAARAALATPAVEFEAVVPTVREAGRPAKLPVLGRFTLDGLQDTPRRPLPAPVTHLAVDSETGRAWGIGHHKVFAVDLEKGTTSEIDLGLDVPELSWPVGIAFDASRNRVILATLGGEGFLYALDVDRERWSVLASLDDVDLAAIAYDPGRDVIWGLDGLSLVRFDVDGRRGKRFGLGEAVRAGDVPTHKGAEAPRLVVVGSRLMLVTTPGDAATKPRLFALDLETAEIATMSP